MTRQLRPMCGRCPWRRLDEEVPADLQEYARGNPDGFKCHVRMGECDGPRHTVAREEKA